jgi:hypothetical protein
MVEYQELRPLHLQRQQLQQREQPWVKLQILFGIEQQLVLKHPYIL